MIIIDLIQQVETDAELTALVQATLTNQQIVWNNAQSAAFMYQSKFQTGDLAPDDQQNNVGFWIKDTIQCLTLEEYKELRYKEVDKKTETIIKLGFTYQSKTFSLSQNAQINILGLDETRNDPALEYPIRYNTIDDLDSYEVADATDLHYMYLTALGTKKAAVDSGTTIKDNIRDAVDAAAVQNIIDNR